MILAFVLTAIPFAFHLWIKPRKASSNKWGSLYSVLSAIYERMKHSDNARKFFTRVFLIVLLFVQYVDFEAANAANLLSNELAQGRVTMTGQIVNVADLSLLDNMFDSGKR